MKHLHALLGHLTLEGGLSVLTCCAILLTAAHLLLLLLGSGGLRLTACRYVLLRQTSGA